MKLFKNVVREIASILAVVAVLCLGAQVAHAQTTFTYNDFSNLSGLQVNGSASPYPGTPPSVLRLTPNLNNQVGSVWYTNPEGTNPPTTVPLFNGFTTTFTLQFSNLGGITSPVNNSPGLGADGVAFLVQNGSFAGYNGDNSGGVLALGPGLLGGELGYTGLTNSVAVQFDTYCNVEYGDNCAASGPSSGDEISVQSCGSAPNTSNHSLGCTFGRVDLSTLATPIYLADGAQHKAQVSYAPPTVAGSCPIGSAPGATGCGSLAVILDGVVVLVVPFNLSYLGLDANDSAYVGFTSATGGAFENQDLVSWTFLAGATSVVNNPINTDNPQDLPSNFNGGTGTFQGTLFGYGSTGGINTDSGTPNPILLSLNNPLSQSNDWPQYVNGTPWATSLCTVKAGNGGIGLCSQYIYVCYDASQSPSTATDKRCPTVADLEDPTKFITLKDTFDWVTDGKPQPLPGTTFSFIDFTPPDANPTENWSPSPNGALINPVCSISVSPLAMLCDISDKLVDVYGDQSTTRATSKPKGSTFVTAYNVPMPLTSVVVKSATGCSSPNSPLNDIGTTDPKFENPSYAANIWNNGACLLDFVVNPAATSTPSNGYQAAPPLSFYYGSVLPVPAVVPGPIPAGDVQVPNNPSPVFTSCPPPGTGACTVLSWDTGVNIPLSTLGEGTHTFHWSARDTAGISEKNVQLLQTGPATACNNPDSDPLLQPPCYNTSYYTTLVNVDLTAPTISASFSTPGSPAGTFGLNQVVYPVYTCADNLSGVANCGGLTPPLNGNGSCPTSPSALTSPTKIDTTTVGPHNYMVTSRDCAGNISQQVQVSYNVAAPSADLKLYEYEMSDSTSRGNTGTFRLIVTDLSAVTANGVTVNTQYLTQAGVLGTITATLSTGTCTNSSCTGWPSSFSSTVACSVSGLSVTCGGPNVNLPPVSTKAGLFLQIKYTVNKTAPLGFFFSASTAQSAGKDPNLGNNTYKEAYLVTK